MSAAGDAGVGGARRRLVICCDGTWNSPQPAGAASNVVRMVRAIRSQAATGEAQIVFYDPGVGTGNWFDRASGGASGAGLSRNVREAYAFLVNNFVPSRNGEAPGDEIFLFGFSRGAYTVRALGGLIGAIGMLQPGDMGSFNEAWNWYRIPHAERRIEDLDRRFPDREKTVPIHCIGVWDTVGALGVPHNRIVPWWHPCSEAYRFHDTRLGGHVRHAFQALAIDERRDSFRPVLWNQDQPAAEGQEIRQVWFCGVHSDVGGGYGDDHGAADIPFLWMAAQVAPLLDLDPEAIRDEPDTRRPYGEGKLHESYTVGWRIAGEYHRRPERAYGQFVHRSVLDRAAGGGYPLNPEFEAFRRLPVWEPDGFERGYRWEGQERPPAATRLPRRRRGFCDWLSDKLSGDDTR